MSRWYIGVGLLAFSAVMLWGILRTPSQTDVPVEEIAERVAKSLPKWANYQEDIKGQIGSTPVARWKGEPVEARVDGSDVFVTFELSGAWAQYDFALPVLLKDHLGKVYQKRDATRNGTRVEYRFQLTNRVEGASLPWVEVAYPHHFERIAFSAQGTWSAVGQ